MPLEFDFKREASNARTIKLSLEEHSEQMPLLRLVVVPGVYDALSTTQLLTMEFIAGVPLLDIAQMDAKVKHHLVSALVLAFGVMILRTGLFHSDPHPGNILATSCQESPAGSPTLRNSAAPQSEIKLALLDFGQAKALSDASRLRFALLVCAMASRDDELVNEVMREAGLLVENCTEDFKVHAGFGHSCLSLSLSSCLRIQAIAGYILFDTRMDFPEALQSPMDPNCNEGFR